jgi:hypothetical protein
MGRMKACSEFAEGASRISSCDEYGIRRLSVQDERPTGAEEAAARERRAFN